MSQSQDATELTMPLDPADKLSFERIGKASRIVKEYLLNPIINYLVPTWFLKFFLRRSKSELLKECLVRPGGWMSMELSYDTEKECKDWLDALVMRWGAMPMALRNRKKLVSRILAGLIREYAAKGHVKVLGIGAGPSRNLLSAVILAGETNVSATCIDLDAEAFSFGKKIWKESGIAVDSVVFLEGDAADLTRKIHIVPQIVKLVGILEYLDDASVNRLLQVAHDCLQEGGSVVTHSVYPGHGVDPFMRRVFGLCLRYRTTEDLIGRLTRAGFGDFQTHSEPIGVYTVIQAVKRSPAISRE